MLSEEEKKSGTFSIQTIALVINMIIVLAGGIYTFNSLSVVAEDNSRDIAQFRDSTITTIQDIRRVNAALDERVRILENRQFELAGAVRIMEQHQQKPTGDHRGGSR